MVDTMNRASETTDMSLVLTFIRSKNQMVAIAGLVEVDTEKYHTRSSC
jgi:hypothetical protein